ncbi:hypothetical protein EGW08_004429 [Elysia chlorotica]|uniref:Vitellogenin domain-containing protein n=1 Tax=Elysia chlorotica TaxID=188477 RepID=A0A3S1BSM6_ELYCH|nr:hypothetical protein EGW08_004429 [Elysia chlorotica]
MEPRLLALLALASVAFAVPIKVPQTNDCATQCKASTKMNYNKGTTYVYDYRVDYSTSMSGASEDSAKLTLTTKAELEVLGPCEMALSLRDTRLFHSDAMGGLKAADGEDNFRRGLEASALRFSYEDGAVEHICTATREEPWVMNVKKGILSAFQNNMDDLRTDQNVTETDVTGTCKTEYKAIDRGYYADTVRKTKDVLSCMDRNDYKTILQMVPYTESSDLQGNPLMKTTHECDQVIERGSYLKSTKCKETHVYRPFSNGQDGVTTFVEQTLTYSTYKQSGYTRKDTISSRDSLLFDHFASRPSVEQARRLTEENLKEICESTSYDVRPETPRLFSELVYALKALDKQTMEEIFGQLKTKSLCPSNNKAFKTFLDALPVVGTSASVSLMTSFLTNEEVDELQAAEWIPSLSFINAPTSEMLLEAKPLIDSDKFRGYALLPVSSMVNNFCFRSNACDQSYAVLSIMASLEKNIPQGCDATSDRFHEILLTLRAIGNAGHASRAVRVITQCLTNSRNPLEIRVAAANAFRRMPCDAESTDLWNTYENADLDSELRIAAYQALMRCPSDATLGKMAASLGGELDEQVGAYVYSHMTNLKQTSDPLKQMVVRAMDNLVIPNKYEASPLKASTNLEASALINKINTGFVAEGNLVWSNEKQVPRSASVNLTVDLFGQSINLVDFGGRVEGLEQLSDSMFGPKAKANSKKAEYRGSFYGRIFGNEMFFLHSDYQKLPNEKLRNQWLDMLITLKQKQELAYTLNKQIMDVSMIIPSVAGLPINVEVNGSAVVDLVLSGKADVMKFSSSPRSLDIDGEIRPSAALEITGTMSVDSHVTKTGLRMRNTLHTSTSLKGRIQLERGELFTVELDSPQEKMEVFDARSKFFILHNNVEQEQKMITENRKEFELCSCDKTAEITGARLCGQISFPNASLKSEGPYFPLTGPSSASLVLHKTDTHTGYKLLVKRITNSRQNVAQISFNTPGSKVNRVILIDLATDYSRKSITAEVATPWKKAEFNGFVINTEELKTISGSLTVDSSDVYGLTAEVKVSGDKKRFHYSPVIEIRRPGADKVRLDGYVAVKGRKSMDVDLSLSGMQKLPYTLKTSVSNGNEEMSFSASASNDGGKSNYSIEASSMLKVPKNKITVLNTKNSLKINTPTKSLVLVDVAAVYKEEPMLLDFDGTLDIHKLMKRPASLKVDIKTQSRKSRGSVYTINTSFKSSPVTGRFTTNISQKKSLSSMKTVLDYTIPKMAKNKITLSGKIKDKSTAIFTKYVVTGDVDVQKNPEYNTDLSLDVSHKKKHTDFDLKIQYGKDKLDTTKRVYLSSVIDRRIRDYTDVKLSYNIEAGAPEYDVQVVLSGKHEHNLNLLDSDVKLTYGADKELKTTIYLKDKSKKKAHVYGQVSVGWPGAEYILNSKLKEEDKNQYVHDITLKNAAGDKHTFDTELKWPNSDSLEFTTKIRLQGQKRVVVSGSAGTNNKQSHASAQFQYGRDVYALSTMAKSLKNRGAEINVELKNPDRRMVLQMNGEKAKHQLDGSIVASWDADRDENKRITLTGSTYNKESRNSISLGGDLAFTSPFEKFENLAGSWKYGSDEAQHDILGKINLGSERNFMTKVNVEKPISLKHLVASIEAETPYKNMLKASANIFHSWEDKVSTVLKGTLNEEHAMLDLEGKGSLKNFAGKATFTSTVENAQEITATASHAIKPEDISVTVEVSHNTQVYRGDLSGHYARTGWDIKTNGDLTFNSPTSKMSTSWEHNNSKRNIHSKFNSKLDEDNLDIQLEASHESSRIEKITGELKIDSSLKPVRDVVISFTHTHGDDMLKTKAELTKKGKTKALSDIKLSKSEGKAGIDFTLKSPFFKDISGNVDATYKNYPISASGEFEWAPAKKVTVQTTVNAERWDDASVDITLTTPASDYKTINLRASNKKEGAELISHANLDYGNRNTIDLETRHAFNDQNKMARLRLSTPFENVRSLETGLRFDGKATDFDSSADFEMVPLVGKFQGSAKYHYGNGMTANLRLDTPYPDYPYFELAASSNEQGRLRKSRIEARLHPREVYSADATYSFDLPISFEANVNSPYPEYDNLGLMIQHNHSPSSVASHGELRYQPDKKIEGDLNADWSSNIEGSMLLTTPFSGYEESKVIVRHQGDMKDFSSHGEIDVAQKKVVADATFKAGYTTDGEFILSSFIPQMERVQVNVMKKGNAKNFKGELSIYVNDEKTEVVYDHKLKKSVLQTSLKLKTPFTETLKLSLEHKGQSDYSFNNDISASYGKKYTLDTDLSLSCDHPNVKSHGSIKYKIGSPQNIARFNFNKFGELKDMTFNSKGSFNDDEINVNGKWKHTDGLEAQVELNTPFENFKSTGINLSHQGHLKAFRSSGRVTYMDNKSISGAIDLTTDVPRQIRLDSNIETPFETFPSASIAFNHDYDEDLKSIKGDISLTTPVAEFGVGSLTYEQTGDISDLTVTTKAKQNGKEVVVLKLKNELENKGVHSKIEFESTMYPDLTLNFDHTEDSSGFITKAHGNLDSDTFSGEVSTSGPIEDIVTSFVVKYNNDAITAMGSLKSKGDYGAVFGVDTPFEGYESSKIEASAALGEDFKDVTGKLTLSTTVNSFGTGEIALDKNGHLDDLDVSVTITKNNVELSNLRVTNTYDESRFTLHLPQEEPLYLSWQPTLTT